jgi:hypothetical protein
MRKIESFIFFLFISFLSFGQMLPITDQQLINTSQNIVSGTILSSKAKWVNNGKYIYTFSKLKVDKVYSGDVKIGDTVSIVVPGGYDPVKDIGMKVSEQAVFETGEETMVFLVKAEGESDAIDYSFLKNDHSISPKQMRVNGFFQGKRKIFLDKKTGLKMINIPNEGKNIELKTHNEKISSEIKFQKKK